MTDLELDEIITVRWPSVVRRAMTGDGDEWTRGFAKSIARNAKRPNWRPTPKQARVMRRLVSELGTPLEAEVILIDD